MQRESYGSLFFRNHWNGLFLNSQHFYRIPFPRNRRYGRRGSGFWWFWNHSHGYHVLTGLREKTIPSGNKLSSTPSMGNNRKSADMNAQNQLVKGLDQYSASGHFQENWSQDSSENWGRAYGDNTTDEILQHPEKLEGYPQDSVKDREALPSLLRPQPRNRDGFSQPGQLWHSQQTSLQIQDFYKEETPWVVGKLSLPVGRGYIAVWALPLLDQLAGRTRVSKSHGYLNASAPV